MEFLKRKKNRRAPLFAAPVTDTALAAQTGLPPVQPFYGVTERRLYEQLCCDREDNNEHDRICDP